MGKFLWKLERFFVNLIVICLILMITSQLIMKHDSAWKRFKNIRSTFKEIFIPEKEVIPVNSLNEKEDGVIVIHLIPEVSLPQVWILKNGKREANFSSGYVICSVNEGDLLTIDSRFYDDGLWYKITSISSSINTLEVGDLFRTSGDTTSLGIIEFNNKL